MHGPNGKHVVSMSWDEYSKWQRWDEWPELNNNPPLTVETTFWYKEKEYLVTSLQGCKFRFNGVTISLKPVQAF